MGIYPGGKRFAFTILDDTDVATVGNVRPVYCLLEQLGMRTTKTVWPLACPEGSRNFFLSQTLDDADYLEFIRDLQRRGFEITWHGATMETSDRKRTLVALERFRLLFGAYPRIHVNHSNNRENIYWGLDRIDSCLLRTVLRWGTRLPPDLFGGHRDSSPYYWGDECKKHFDYCRNLTFSELNVAAVNPSMPYQDRRRPMVPWWFSAADAEDALEFEELLSVKNLNKLEQEGGFSIVATHLGKGFAANGQVDSRVRERLEDVASRPGWFPTAGELLDWLRARRRSTTLPKREWRRMQWRWAWDLAVRKWKYRRRK